DTYTSDGPSTGDGCFTCPGDAINADWFKFTPTENTSISISSCISGEDTHFYVYSGSCGGLIEVAANDDAGCGVGTNFASSAELEVIGGTEYFIEWVDHWANAEFQFIIEEIACPSPSNMAFNILTDETVEVTWTSSNIGTDFIIEYGEFGFTPGEGLTITGTIGTDGPPVTLEGLLPSTSYEAYLVETCDGGDVTTPSINFTTFDFLAPNDQCVNAIDIACDETIEGSTINATMDLGALTCGSLEVNANGVWYHYVGQDEFVTLSTCGAINFDSKVSVYSGACGDFTCVSANDDDLNCIDFSSTTHFPAESGVDYYILVHGFEGVSGEFQISLTCEPLCSPIPENGSCGSAIAITTTEGCIATTTANTCASINLFNPECSPFQETQDIWYSFNSGDALAVGINITLIDAEEMGFSIYENCSDQSIICLENANELEAFTVNTNTNYLIQFWSQYDDAGSFEFCLQNDVCSGASDISVGSITGNSAEINWTPTNIGLEYNVEYGEEGFILGNGNSLIGVIGTDGPPVTISGLIDGTLYEYYVIEDCEFGEIISGAFTFTTDGSAPSNDECINAFDIDACGGYTAGTTINANSGTGIPDCLGVVSTSPGVWYQMEVSSGDLYAVSTCNDANFDTKISVFAGACDDLECIIGADDSPLCNDGTSTVTFNGYNGVAYVLVHGFGMTSGDFNLTTECSIGVEDLSAIDRFEIFPNPAKDNVTIVFDPLIFTGYVDLSIFNIQGQKILEMRNNNLGSSQISDIDVGNLSTGLYTMILSDGIIRLRNKLVIE
ncbi:MAG: hypothetical protein ACI86P_002508, partial [Flavobacteriales bacterium]